MTEYDPEAEHEAFLDRENDEDQEDVGHTYRRGCRKCGEPLARCGCELEGEEDLIDGVGFADPGGESALRRATCFNPRDRPCPSCHAPNRLTRADVRAHYQCDACAEAVERGIDRDYVCKGSEGGCEICNENEAEAGTGE